MVLYPDQPVGGQIGCRQPTPRISIQTPPERTSFEALKDYWQAADELGVFAAYTFDHLVPLHPGEGPAYRPHGPREGGQLEAWSVVSALAAVTRRVRVGTLVTNVTLREPGVLAKTVVSVDHISGGRSMLGIGAGWHHAEHAMFGIRSPSPHERLGRLTETAQIMRLLMASEGPVTFKGQWYSLQDAYFEPKPVHGSVPILIGGSGRKARLAAARYGDVFNTFAHAEAWPGLNAELNELLRQNGRSPGDLQRSAFVFADLSGDAARQERLVTQVATRSGISMAEAAERVVVADPERAWRTISRLAEAGVDEVILALSAPYDPADLERFAQLALADRAAPTSSEVNH
ncbi:LLM class flavin-dependent oxidoreductase [Dactylosporangium roseum]|uniref:LLM class flavin-dependent oxidoreductase n=1 Tax=Dactylosporangium roseum TaxID=47989 RepID=A0ABY5YYG6_9ACTN|nr:LLM class flavin-dependent oxidoreductase [Dactylosporangium roseum]UWZ34577.1 LLM class flavin-dependent oxidoreductase [Dactylosporangium roseum]